MASGKAFTDRLFGLRKRAATGEHELDKLCVELSIEHCLTPAKSSQTSGMVARELRACEAPCHIKAWLRAGRRSAVFPPQKHRDRWEQCGADCAGRGHVFVKRHIKRLSELSRSAKSAFQISIDAVSILLSFVAAILLRLESLAPLATPQVWYALVATIAITLLTFRLLGLYHTMVRFLTGKILRTVGVGASVSALALAIAGLIFQAGLSRSIPIIFGIFVFLCIGGARFAAQNFFRSSARMIKRPVIVYGAGESGLKLLNALSQGREYTPVALVDDNPRLQNLSVGGVRVHAPERISQLAQKTAAQIVLLAIPSASRARRREIVQSIQDLGLEIKTIPGMVELISGKARIAEMSMIRPEDLLGRDPVPLEPDLLSKNLSDCSVMVSGAGGSIGSELCRQILAQNPKILVLFEVSEYALYVIEAELSATAARLQKPTRIIPVLGSVQHPRRLEAVIKAFGVQTIYHAAAYKHVPLVEENVVEGIRNNAFGTLAIANAARKLGVRNFILISTDKAVRPTNVMGASKRIAELICQAHAKETSQTVFSMVRFGNVLGSSGSVIPRFRAQIESGGPVTVTHKDITRYFMTIPEASQLVIQAGAMAKGGDVFVLDMGEPIRILDVATSMIKLHGLRPYLKDHPDQASPKDGDIPICITGLRKGEKLYEELLIGNNPSSTAHPRIMTASEVSLGMDELQKVLDRLLQACLDFDLRTIMAILHELPLEYTPQGDPISDLIWSEHACLEQGAESTAPRMGP